MRDYGLPGAWRRRADELRALGHEPTARAFEACADEMETAARDHAHELLTLDEAAAESGYDYSSLSRLLSRREHLNAGKRGAPRIARRDLPRKPGHRANGG